MKSFLLLVCVLVPSAVSGQANDEVDFSHEIVPLFRKHCVECHAGAQKEGALSLNNRESMLTGGDGGPVVELGSHAESELYLRITSDSDYERMPPEGPGLSEDEASLIAKWIDQGAKWEPGFSFGEDAYEPPLAPRRPELPPPTDQRTHPIDRLLDHRRTSSGLAVTKDVNDEAFLRRASLDLVGLLPTPEQRRAFLHNSAPGKRAELVRELLNRDVDYAEHWLTFWNDLLRNDYAGTGFITGGRKQITKWLYESLVTNKPYNVFVQELIAPPSDASSGFSNGIRWRGEVSAGQQVEIQFAQNVGQVFLGINLKCASCHNSFIDRWTLEDAYGLAAIYSEKPMELHRCDKPLGEVAQPAWLFDEHGKIDAEATREIRLSQLAQLMTDDENGRFARTIVNRLWHRMMGRGIVHPTDAMQTKPWDEDLLDYLACYLVDHDYDLKQLLFFIATSKAYQSRAESVEEDADAQPYVYAGPRSKRMTAEQFVDCVWQLTGASPRKFDAEVLRVAEQPTPANRPLLGKWIWNQVNTTAAPAGETIAFRRKLELLETVQGAFAVVSCDNEYALYVNGNHIGSGANWNQPDLWVLEHLRSGSNEITIIAKNGGTAPNPAGLFFEAYWDKSANATQGGDDSQGHIATDTDWEWTRDLRDDKQRLPSLDAEWKRASEVDHATVWMGALQPVLQEQLALGAADAGKMVRASLLKSDFLMRSLGRPNRDQVVTVRPLELTTLEAIDLSIGTTLSEYLRAGAKRIAKQPWSDAESMVQWIFQFALCRQPTDDELDLLCQSTTDVTSESAIEDILWAVVMLPEFQIVR